MYLLSLLHNNRLLSLTSGKEHHGSTSPASNVLESVAARPRKTGQSLQLVRFKKFNSRIISSEKCNTFLICTGMILEFSYYCLHIGLHIIEYVW